MAFPKVLFLTSEPPHSAAAGAIVFHRLLTAYPVDRLLVVTNSLPPTGAERLECRYVHLPLWADRLQRTRLWPWRNRLSVLGAPNLVRLDRVDQAVGSFAPTVVVTLMQDSWCYVLAARYARAHRLPLLLFVHDLPHIFEPVPARLQPRQCARDRAVARSAAARLFISDGMRSWFHEQAGLDGDVLPPPRSAHGFAQPAERCRTLKRAGQLTLGYAGGLHYGYGEQLLRLLPAFRATGTRVEIFGPTPAGAVARLRDAVDVCQFHGYAPTPEEAWRAIEDRCDAVLQPYLNPPGTHALQYRTHFPSKLGDALTLGLPLLLTGPREAAGVAWCEHQAGIAAIVSDPSLDAFETMLRRLRDDGDWRVSLARQGQAAARAFDLRPLQAQLVEHLQRISAHPA